MPITLTPIGNKSHWSGFDWSINDEDEIAELVARVALGQYRHVLKVLAGTGFTAYAPADNALKGAIKLLTATDPAKPWHRDGWLFQVLSWIAANVHPGDELIKPPQMIHAHKGFDGLHLQIDPAGNVTSIVICEDKATKNPRATITGKVWTEFEQFHAGTRNNELVAEIGPLLQGQAGLDVDSVAAKILWDEARAYRVSITIGDNECSESGRNEVFKGFSKTVPGAPATRRAETLHLSNLRGWMNNIALKAIDAAKKIEAEKDV